MATIEDLVRAINRDLSPQFEERLREGLADKDREWLVDQLVRLTLGAQGLADLDRAQVLEQKARHRQERVARVTALELDAPEVRAFTADYSAMTRERAVSDGHLLPAAPPRGADLIAAEHRTESGDALLLRSKDLLFGLLFGDAATGTRLHRVQQELLTLALPRAKAAAFDFMRASTELAAAGTWQDPASVSNDERADNVLLEVQFGETADEVVGSAIVVALSVINNLEINEQVLYARMINIEESTLIS